MRTGVNGSQIGTIDIHWAIWRMRPVARTSPWHGTYNANKRKVREMWPEFADVQKMGRKVECLEGRCSIQLSYGRLRNADADIECRAAESARKCSPLPDDFRF